LPGAESNAESEKDEDGSGRPLAQRWREGRDARAAKSRRGPEGHTPGVTSFVVMFERPVPWLGFSVTLGHILSEHGKQLLRVKGLINVAGTLRPQIIQCVQGAAYPSVTLPVWPKEGPFSDG
jgi:G3E family GTPase